MRALRVIFGFLLGLFLLFILFVGPGLLAPPIVLLIGWWPSAARLFNAWHPHVVGVILFVLAMVVLVVGTHAFAGWTYRHLRSGESSLLPNWRWKWTLGGFGVVFCTLAAISSLVLTTHQLYWLSKSSEPMFTDPFRGKAMMWHVAYELQKKAEEVQWDTLKTRTFWKEEAARVTAQPALETMQPIWVEQNDHQLRAIILVPRRPVRRDRARVVVIQQGANLVNRKLDELPQVLASFGIGEVARTDKSTLLP
jgi:hypothetical protein